jgi:hypothetical protein
VPLGQRRFDQVRTYESGTSGDQYLHIGGRFEAGRKTREVQGGTSAQRVANRGWMCENPVRAGLVLSACDWSYGGEVFKTALVVVLGVTSRRSRRSVTQSGSAAEISSVDIPLFWNGILLNG